MEEQYPCPYSLSFGQCNFRSICALKIVCDTCFVYKRKQAAEKIERRDICFNKLSRLETVKPEG